MTRTMLLAGMVCAMVAVPVRGQGKESAAASGEMSYHFVQVVEVAHQNPRALARDINALKVPVRAAGVGEDKLLLAGPQDTVTDLIERVIPALDRPGATARETVAFVPMGTVDDAMVNSLLQSMFPDLRVMVDHGNRVLGVRGTEAEIRTVRELIGQLDKPTRQLTLRFDFLRASLQGNDENADLPADLNPVAAALAETGFRNVRRIAPVMVTIEAGERFHASAKYNPLDADGHSREQLSIDVEGRAQLRDDGNTAQVQARSRVTGAILAGEQDWMDVRFDNETSIAARLGSYVVLAAGPSTTSEGDAIILVVRITAVE